MAYGVITVAALVRLAQSWDSVPEEEAESKPVRARQHSLKAIGECGARSACGVVLAGTR